MNSTSKQLVYLLLTLLTVVGGYTYLRYAYKVTDSTPFTQEIVLIILGTIATVFITALLLNKQSAVEIEKEQNIKFLELKTKTYEKLLDLIEEMSTKKMLTGEDINRLQYVTHRLAIFASAAVLNEYDAFLKTLSELTDDGTFVNDRHALNEALGKLTIQIRFDLLDENPTGKTYTVEQVKRLIRKNSDRSLHINIG